MKLLKESYSDHSIYAVVDDHGDILRVYEYDDEAKDSLRSYEEIMQIEVPTKFIVWLENKLVLEDA